MHLYTSVSFASKTVKTFGSHLGTKEAYFIKWTTSGESPEGSKRTKDFFFRRNKQLFLDPVEKRKELNDNSIYFLIQCQYYHHSLEVRR